MTVTRLKLKRGDEVVKVTNVADLGDRGHGHRVNLCWQLAHHEYHDVDIVDDAVHINSTRCLDVRNGRRRRISTRKHDLENLANLACSNSVVDRSHGRVESSVETTKQWQLQLKKTQFTQSLLVVTFDQIVTFEARS